MTEREARAILIRAIEAGAFDSVADAWEGETPEELREPLGECADSAERSYVWDRYLTGSARAIAEGLLGEPFDFPSWRDGWQTVCARNEEPLWAAIFETGDGYDDADDEPAI